MPELSVIMPVFNTEKFLKRSIDSVLNQTFKDLELILVNDGSTDKSLSICLDYAKNDSRVIVIDKANEGAGPARNKGIEIARGKYIAFSDSDDWLDLECYETCINKIQKTNADLLVFGVRTHVYNDESDNVLEIREEKLNPVFYSSQDDCRKHWVELHKSCNMNAPWNKIYKSDIITIRNIKYPYLRVMEDGVFNMGYYDKILSVVVLENNFYNRTWHSNEFQNKKMPNNLLECLIKFHTTALDKLQKWNVAIEGNRDHFDEIFIETINTIIFTYRPNDTTFIGYYKYVKNTNNNEYTRKIFSVYKKHHNFTKKQRACYYRWNLIIAIYLRFFRKAK